MIDLSRSMEFEWDGGNVEKNWIRHRVTTKECEEVFLNLPTVFFPDDKHSHDEKRFGIFGKTHAGRKLMVVFTVRNNTIRVISARNQGRKERKIYASYEKEAEKNS